VAQVHHVALVLDREFGARLADLARDVHVWAVRSAADEDAATRVWATPPRHSQLSVTLFDASDHTAEEACADILSTIDEHHGEYSDDRALDAMEVSGVGLTQRIEDELAALRFDAEPSDQGFIAVRRRGDSSRRAK
jgi:hypothetical protein